MNIIYRKCKTESCEEIIKVTPHEQRTDTHHYCCKACSWVDKVGKSKYDVHIPFIQANLLKLGIKGVADAIGVDTMSLKKRLSTYRSQGVQIPSFEKNCEIGTIKPRKVGDKRFLRVKTADGWRSLGIVVENGVQIPVRKPVKKEKPVKAPRAKAANPCNHGKPPKPEVKKFTTRVIDKTNTRTVRFNSKTEIAFVPNHISDEQAIANYAAKLAARVG